MNALEYIVATVEPGTAQVSIESVCKAAPRLGLVLATRSNTGGVQTSTVSLVGEFIGTRSASSVIYDVSLRIYETETHVFTNKLYALGWESQLPIATMSEIQSSVRSIRTAVRRALAMTPRLGADHICSLCRVDSQWHSRIVNDLQSIHNTAVATVEPVAVHNGPESMLHSLGFQLDHTTQGHGVVRTWFKVPGLRLPASYLVGVLISRPIHGEEIGVSICFGGAENIDNYEDDADFNETRDYALKRFKQAKQIYGSLEFRELLKSCAAKPHMLKVLVKEFRSRHGFDQLEDFPCDLARDELVKPVVHTAIEAL